MNKFFFYGTLRSIPILETVIGHKSDYLEFIPAFAPRSELRLVINETFPVIVFNHNYAGVQGTLVKGLNGEDINRILFFEDVEFTPRRRRLLLSIFIFAAALLLLFFRGVNVGAGTSTTALFIVLFVVFVFAATARLAEERHLG